MSQATQPYANNKIWEHITFSGRKGNYPRANKDKYVFNEYYFLKALKDYINLQPNNGLSSIQLQHIINSFSSAPVDSFLYELYQIFNLSDTGVNIDLYSIRSVLIELCNAVQQDNMHDFYDLGRSLVSNFKFLAKSYINHGEECKFVHLKEQNFIDLGLPSLKVFTNDHHVDGKYIIDTISDEHKKLLGSIENPKQTKKKPEWLYSTDPKLNRISVPISGTLDGTGSTKKTERCLQFDCIYDKEEAWKSGAIELGIYSIGAIALASMFDLVCYISNTDVTYKYIFYPFFKFNGDDDKEVVFKTKTVLMVLVRYNPENNTSVSENILVNNRSFTVANVSKDIYKVYKTIEKAESNGDANDTTWFNKLKTDNLFMGILKLCVPDDVRDLINEGHPHWTKVKDYINNARHLYTKMKIFGKGLGDFNQAFEELVLNNFNNYNNGAFVLHNNSFNHPTQPTTPLALLTIDRNLTVICKIIGANFLLSSPGYFSTNPDSIYNKYRTLQECHNAFNSVPIICVKYDNESPGESKLFISIKEANNIQKLHSINLGTWTTQSHNNNYNKVTIEESIGKNSDVVLSMEINYDYLGLVTASVEIINDEVSKNRISRVFARNILDAYEYLEVTLNTNLKKIVEDKRFFICYYPPKKSSESIFKLKYLLCGTFKEIISEPITDSMYKPVAEDIYANVVGDAGAAIKPYNPLSELFFNIRYNLTYWSDTTSTSTWKPQVRKLRLDMKKNFDVTNKFNICREAYLAYSLFDMVYPKKCIYLNALIEDKCTLSEGESPVDKIDGMLPNKFKLYFSNESQDKKTTSYLNLVHMIKSEHYIDIDTQSNMEAKLYQLLISNLPQYAQTNRLTLDNLFECIDLVGTTDNEYSILFEGKTNNTNIFMINSFTSLLDKMSKKFQENKKYVVQNMAPHTKIYKELNLEIDTVYDSLFTQYKDAENIMLLYFKITSYQYTFYTHTKSVYKKLIEDKVLPSLRILFKMLIKAKRRYFSLLSMIESDPDSVFAQIKAELEKELHGLDDNVQAPGGPAASGSSAADPLGPNPDTHLIPKEITAIDSSKNIVLMLNDPDNVHVSPLLSHQLQANIKRDLDNANKEKEKCEIFMKINDDLNNLYTKYVNTSDTIAEICLKGRGKPINKSNKNYKYTSSELIKFKNKVLLLFYRHPFSHIVKFHKKLGLLLELENLAFILNEKLESIQSDDNIKAMSPRQLVTAYIGVGGNMGYKYKKNKNKINSYMKGGAGLSNEILDKFEYKTKKREIFLNEYIVDNLYEEDFKKNNLSLIDVDEMQVDSTNASPLSQTHFSPELSPLPPDTLTRSPSASHSRTYSASSQETLPRDNIYEMLPPRKRQKIKGGRKPKAEAKKPKAESKIAKAESKIAKTEAKKPKAESKIAKAEAKKPKAESKKPKAEAKKPKAESKIAKTEAKKPKAEVKKPKAEVKKPKAEAKKPKAEAKKPKAEAEPKRALLLKFKF